MLTIISTILLRYLVFCQNNPLNELNAIEQSYYGLLDLLENVYGHINDTHRYIGDKNELLAFYNKINTEIRKIDFILDKVYLLYGTTQAQEADNYDEIYLDIDLQQLYQDRHAIFLQYPDFNNKAYQFATKSDNVNKSQLLQLYIDYTNKLVNEIAHSSFSFEINTSNINRQLHQQSLLASPFKDKHNSFHNKIQTRIQKSKSLMSSNIGKIIAIYKSIKDNNNKEHIDKFIMKYLSKLKVTFKRTHCYINENNKFFVSRNKKCVKNESCKSIDLPEKGNFMESGSKKETIDTIKESSTKKIFKYKENEHIYENKNNKSINFVDEGILNQKVKELKKNVKRIYKLSEHLEFNVLEDKNELLFKVDKDIFLINLRKAAKKLFEDVECILELIERNLKKELN